MLLNLNSILHVESNSARVICRVVFQSAVTYSNKNKKFELILTRRAKAYSNSCSQIVLVYLQRFRRNSLVKCALQPKNAKINKTFYFGSSGFFELIDVDTTKKLVASACCDRQHAQCLSATVFKKDRPTAVK